jgi:hypothetical protein
VHGDKTYDLSHLNECLLVAKDSGGVERRITVTFVDHCFTRPSQGEGDEAPLFPDCSRPDGRFCTERYSLSHHIKSILDQLAKGDVWNSAGEHYVIFKKVEHQGRKIDYVVVFSLDRLSGHSSDLHMHVRSAHKRDQDPIDTFGSVRFAHLIKLRMERKRPSKIFNHKRKRPR